MSEVDYFNLPPLPDGIQAQQDAYQQMDDNRLKAQIDQATEPGQLHQLIDALLASN